MKIRAIVIQVGIPVVVVMTTSLARADRAKHEEKYCSALSAVSADLATLDALGPSATVGQLRANVEKIDTDTKAVDREARKIKTETSKRFVEAADQLYNEARSLPDGLTIEEARTRLGGDVQAVKRTARALADESGCPEAMPTTKAPAE
jgi:hypothetical protein